MALFPFVTLLGLIPPYKFRFWHTPSLCLQDNSWMSLELGQTPDDVEVKPPQDILKFPFQEYDLPPYLDNEVYAHELSSGDCPSTDRDALIQFPLYVCNPFLILGLTQHGMQPGSVGRKGEP